MHFTNGAWGLLAASLFATPWYYDAAFATDRGERCAGVFYGGKASGSLVAAFACIGVILAWVGSTMTLLFGTLSAMGQLRVTADVESQGLDDSKHGGNWGAYKLEQAVAEGKYQMDNSSSGKVVNVAAAGSGESQQ